jgi:hypothetical protein
VHLARALQFNLPATLLADVQIVGYLIYADEFVAV